MTRIGSGKARIEIYPADASPGGRAAGNPENFFRQPPIDETGHEADAVNVEIGAERAER